MPLAPRILKTLAASFFFLFPAALAAQIPPLKPPPLQPPSGSEQGCSLEKSCADLAPAMIRSALGDSPLEANVRDLVVLTNGHSAGTPAENAAVIAWAVAAFRRSRVDEVHTEKFTFSAGNRARAVESQNVVAEIRGRDLPNEFVLLSAHLDSGILDDAGNAAMVIDAARVIASSGSIPRRSIRFVLFTGPSDHMPGSRAYAQAHQQELDAMIASIAFDIGENPVTRYSLAGRNDALPAVRDALEPAHSLGVENFTLDAVFPTDSLPFLLEGVPTLTPTSTFSAAFDTIDKAALDLLKTNVAIAAITAYALADAPERIAPRQSPAEVQQLLKATGLDKQIGHEVQTPPAKR